MTSPLQLILALVTVVGTSAVAGPDATAAEAIRLSRSQVLEPLEARFCASDPEYSDTLLDVTRVETGYLERPVFAEIVAVRYEAFAAACETTLRIFERGSLSAPFELVQEVSRVRHSFFSKDFMPKSLLSPCGGIGSSLYGLEVFSRFVDGHQVVLVGFSEVCVGTGRESFPTLLAYDGHWHAIEIPDLGSVASGFLAIGQHFHGHDTPTTVFGRSGFHFSFPVYDANDPNCCPSYALEGRFRLERRPEDLPEGHSDDGPRYLLALDSLEVVPRVE
jgi:hypothetical protein